jgi:hypothetical protein
MSYDGSEEQKYREGTFCPITYRLNQILTTPTTLASRQSKEARELLLHFGDQTSAGTPDDYQALSL